LYTLDNEPNNNNYGLNGVVNQALSNLEKKIKISVKFPDISQIYEIGKEVLFGSNLNGELSKLNSQKKKNKILKNSNIQNLQVYIDNLIINRQNYFSIFQNKQSNAFDLENFILPKNEYFFNFLVIGPSGSGKSILLDYLTGHENKIFSKGDRDTFQNKSGKYIGKYSNVSINLYDTPGTDSIKFLDSRNYFTSFNETISNKLINLVLYVIPIDRIKVTRDFIICQLLSSCSSSNLDHIEGNIVFVFSFVDKLTYEESCVIKQKIDNFINEFNFFIGRKQFITKFCVFDIEDKEKNYGLDNIIKFAVNSLETVLIFNKVFI
jgi:energy-coupling factor transporter ATP-binding protein EcfA2